MASGGKSEKWRENFGPSLFSFSHLMARSKVCLICSVSEMFLTMTLDIRIVVKEVHDVAVCMVTLFVYASGRRESSENLGNVVAQR